MRRIIRLLPLPLGIAFSLPALAADPDKHLDWSLCPVRDAVPAFPGVPATPAKQTGVAELPVQLAGDSTSGEEGVEANLQGNVHMVRGSQFLGSDTFHYDEASTDYTANGGVRYQDSSLRLTAASASGNTDADTHRMQQVQYQLINRRGNGSANSAEISGNLGLLTGATYSTCDPGQRSWELNAQRIDLDTENGFGVAHHATLRIGRVPVLYMPWFMFPTDNRRRTGLLYPSIGFSGRNGFDWRQPIYLNLAPNYDATITPRLMTARGLMVSGEFRYLNRGGRGVVEAAFMPNDRLRNRDRGMFGYTGVQGLGPHWQFRSNVRWVSDTHFTEDFSRNLYGYANYYLNSSAGIYGRGQYWDASISASHYQLTDYTLTKTNLPYDRVPEADFSWARPFARWLTLGVDAQAVRFAQPVLDGGSRVDLKPYIALPLQGAGWFLTPKLAWRYTAYDIDRALAASLGGNRTPSRSLPIMSLDAGLQFERSLDRWGQRWTQTLEPRLFYLRVPYRDQTDLPLFDTQPLTFSWGQLFRDNRYSGADRQTDANQLTMALTTRMLRQSDGLEKFSASVGQILYFNDSLVTVPGETPVPRGRSAWVVDANYLPSDRWSLGASYQWDPKYRHQDLASLRARYLIGDRGIVNVAYRYRRNLIEQFDASALYPLNPSWSLVGRYYYSIRDRTLLEGIAGVQWESCCVAVRVVARRYVRNRVGDLNTAVQVEFELKGLGSAGPGTERVLRRAILGYDRDDLSLTPSSLLNANDVGVSTTTPIPSP